MRHRGVCQRRGRGGGGSSVVHLVRTLGLIRFLRQFAAFCESAPVVLISPPSSPWSGGTRCGGELSRIWLRPVRGWSVRSIPEWKLAAIARHIAGHLLRPRVGGEIVACGSPSVGEVVLRSCDRNRFREPDADRDCRNARGPPKVWLRVVCPLASVDLRHTPRGGPPNEPDQIQIGTTA